MEIPLSFSAPAAAAAVGPVLPRAITTKVQAIEPTDPSATLPDNKHYVAQVVTARLSGAEYPDNPSEIAPPERTLRPYDVPMLPYETKSGTTEPSAADAPAAADDRDQTTA
ncbi:hypothetical protein [Loktanella sp. 5RATIMAR09]|uniref:hypothetical protein n=1 Tax=Loktanella sp. 5RATIMAR09 TaxID=1225655 RepID=UPI0006EB9DB3|nr:hypothetical protein [Loktanella sp. 5RATIMAR09]